MRVINAMIDPWRSCAWGLTDFGCNRRSFDPRPLPNLAVLIMKFLRAMKNLGRRQPIGQWQEHVQEVFRSDARAEGEEVWIGGWALDHTDLRRCPQNCAMGFWSGRKLQSHCIFGTFVDFGCASAFRDSTWNRQSWQQPCGHKMHDHKVPSLCLQYGACSSASKPGI